MHASRRLPIETLLVDLDDCLYECPQLSQMVAEKIRRYMVERLGVAEAEVVEKCSELYLNFGTTCAGLVATGHDIDFEDWHNYVHATLPYEALLRPDPKLAALLDSIPLPKYIFTNADAAHAERCLALLGLRDCFQGIICFETIMAAAAEAGLVHHNRPVVCKPQRQAIQLALQQAGGAEAATTAFFDDSARNIAAAHHLGVFSVLVGRTGVDCASDVQLRSMHDLPAGLPWLCAVGDGRPPMEVAAAAVGNPTLEEAEEAPRAAVYVAS